jgi:polysaccharide export outer membrane protein
LRQLIGAAYSKILHDPEITVLLKDFDKPYFTATGQVGHPGKYDLRADTTVAEALAIAGGMTEKSKDSQVLLFRRVSSDWVSVKMLDVKAIYKGQFDEDVHLHPGDMLFVPQNRFSKIKPFLPVWALSTYMTPGGGL